MATRAYPLLTPEEQSGFEQSLAKFGLSRAKMQHEEPLITGSMPGPIILSTDIRESTIAPHFIKINDVAEYKRLGGVPDQEYELGRYSDAFIEYPEPWSDEQQRDLMKHNNVCDLEILLADEGRTRVEQAFRAYVRGNTNKVKQYEPLINTLHFPMVAAVFAGDSIVITAKQPLIVKSPDGRPVVLVFATVTIEPGGQIISEATMRLEAQIMRTVGNTTIRRAGAGSLRAESNGTDPIVVNCSNGANAKDGTAGGRGANGRDGTPGVCGGKNNDVCVTQATNGDNGGVGGTGGDSSDGGNAPAAYDQTFQVNSLSGLFQISVLGGKGGDGGNGGDGGTGGNGGKGGTATSCCTAGLDGKGGKGGKGGNGGNGGKGANGPTILIEYRTLGDFSYQFTSDSGQGGRGGAGGKGGLPGTGRGDDGSGEKGTNGKVGPSSTQPGQVIMRQI